MTNTLHRRGDIDFLKKDWVAKATPIKGVDDADDKAKQEYVTKIRDMCDVISKYATNLGAGRRECFARGHSLEQIKHTWDNQRVMGIRGWVMNSRDDVKSCLQDLKDREYGISITVSGLIDDLVEIGREIDLPPHSILLSLGIWGKKELLPPEDVLTLTSMCGHNLVTANLVKHVAAQMKEGELSLETATQTLAQGCVCGAMNTLCARELLEKMVASETGADN
jgi:hypothetical protein